MYNVYADTTKNNQQLARPFKFYKMNKSLNVIYHHGRKIVLATLFLLSAFAGMNKASAQLLQQILSISEIKASLDAAKEKEGGYSAVEKKADIGFNVGVFFAAKFGIPISKNEVDNSFFEEKQKGEGGFALSLGLQYIRKGSKDKEGDAKTTLGYIELSPGLLYYRDFPGGSFYAGLGPYIAYGIGGKVSGSGFSEKAFSGDGYKRFDAGPRIMAEYILPAGLSIGLAYEYGLVDKSSNPSDYTSKNRAFSIDVGYSLKKLFGK